HRPRARGAFAPRPPAGGGRSEHPLEVHRSRRPPDRRRSRAGAPQAHLRGSRPPHAPWRRFGTGRRAGGRIRRPRARRRRRGLARRRRPVPRGGQRRGAALRRAANPRAARGERRGHAVTAAGSAGGGDRGVRVSSPGARGPTLLQAQRWAGTLTAFSAFAGCAVYGEMGAALVARYPVALVVASLAVARFLVPLAWSFDVLLG